MSTITKLSDDTDRRLTASAGYDSCVQFHWPSAWCTKPSSPSTPSTAGTILLSEALVGRERQLERRALDVIEQDLQVVRVDQRVLRRGAEEVVGMPDDELIERRARGHQHRGGSTGRGGRPGRRAARSRQSCPDSRPSPTRRARRCRCRARARSSTPPRARCPRAARARSRAAAAAGSRRDSRAPSPGEPGGPWQSSFEIGGENLGGQAALREDDDLQVPPQELERHAARLGQIRPADPELAVDHRRVDEDEELLGARRAALVDQRHRPSRSGARRARPGWRWSPRCR